MSLLARLFVTHRAWVGVACAVFSLLALFGASRLQIDDVPSSLFRSEDEAYALLEEVFRDFGTDDTDCLVVLEAEQMVSPEGTAVIRALDRRLGEIPEVETFSMADVLVFDGALLPRPLLPFADGQPEAFDRARELAQAHPLVGDQLLSKDGRMALMVARVGGADVPISVLRRRLDAVRQIVEEVTADSPVRARLTGVPAIRVVIFENLEREQRLFAVLGALVGLLVALVIFQRPGPVVITSVASMMAGFWAAGFMGLVGQPMNLLTSGLPMMVMMIAFTDAMHLMIDTLRSQRQGLTSVEAAAHSIRDLGLPCALTSLTTAVGFGSLAVSRVEIIQTFGTFFAASVIMTFFVVLTFVPLLSSIVLRKSQRASLASRFSGLQGPAERLIRWVVRRARAVAALGVLLTLALLVVGLQLRPDNRLVESTPRGSDTVAALHDLEAHFGGVLSANVLVEWPSRVQFPDPEVLTVLGEVRRVLRESPFVHGTLSVLDLLEALPPGGGNPERARLLKFLPDGLLERFLRPERRRALVTARVPDANSQTAQPAYDELEAALSEVRSMYPDYGLYLTGTGVVAHRNVDLMIVDFSMGLGIAALVIFGMLSIAYRSLRIGLISLLPNAFPLVVAAAILVFLGRELQIASAIAFTICLGIAVDDTIHFLSRFRRELALDGDVEEAVVRAFMAVGRALVVTTSVLVGGFSVMFLSVIPTTQLFALIGIVGMLAALVGDLFLLPAILVIFAVKDPRALRPEVRP
ncbi:MAG: MMPL family transporter [Planctomycetota bacterium]